MGSAPDPSFHIIFWNATMETQLLASDMEVDLACLSAPPSKSCKGSVSGPEDFARAKDLLRDRYQAYLLRTSAQLAPAACCTALVPYVENTHLKALKEQQPLPAVEMMEVEVPSLKRKRCDDFFIPFAPKLAKLSCL